MKESIEEDERIWRGIEFQITRAAEWNISFCYHILNVFIAIFHMYVLTGVEIVSLKLVHY
jgi:hypothetical protein